MAACWSYALMNVFYEESASYKVASVVSKNEASLQVDTLHGKRAKIKQANVLIEFNSPLGEFLPAAEALAADIDIDLLWEFSGQDEFDFSDLSHEYWGEQANSIQQAAIVLRLASSPMYFYKKGKGRYKAAPEDALKAALAGQERRRQEQAQMRTWADQLIAGQLPEALEGGLMKMLWQPDKNTLEFKAFDLACKESNLPPLRLAEKVGGIRSVPEYLMAGFELEYFPKGTGFGQYDLPTVSDDLPLAEVAAFSIDDAGTTEIDDALSLQYLADGITRVGIHIAAPALGIQAESPLERLIHTRLSTVYFPGDKITMLPKDVVDVFTLQEGQACPALSLYVDVSPEGELLSFENKIERVTIAKNLRHDSLEPLFNENTIDQDGPDYPFKRELTWLFHFAETLEKRRGRYDPTRPVMMDYNFDIVDGKVLITQRRRGAPMDKLVSELMILANSEWGRMLGEAGIPALYRAQSMGKVRMTTKPEPHVGLGVPQYAWATSPLRRASDFANQLQLIAMIREEKPRYTQGDAMLFALLRDFDTTYSAYLGFQDKMEHFWCLRWFTQEGVSEIMASSIKEDLVRLEGLPMRLRVPGLPEMQNGDRVKLQVIRIDELMQEIEFRAVGNVEPAVKPEACPSV